MADKEELLDPSDIEALLGAGAAGPPAAALAAEPPTAAMSQDDLDALLKQPSAPPAAIDPGGIESLLKQRAAPPRPAHAAERSLDDMDADLAAALAGGSSRGRDYSALGEPRQFEFDSFDRHAPAQEGGSLDLLNEVELDLCIELGRSQLLIEEVLKLREGSVVPLDKLAGDPVDVLVNGRLIARGEVLVLNDNFCVRIAEILSPSF